MGWTSLRGVSFEYAAYPLAGERSPFPRSASSIHRSDSIRFPGVSMPFLRRAIVAIAAFSSLSLSATVDAFKASKACPMYQSMRKKENPGNLQTAADSVYALAKLPDSQKKAGWVLVKVPGNTDRWVESGCGGIVSRVVVDTPAAGGSCSAPFTYDSHVFAISWQAGFCQDKRKTECDSLSKEPYARSHFTLHGLWPNKTSCGTNYGWCGSVTHDTTDFCYFPVVPLDSQVRTMLGTVMPSVKYGTCLERHEWWKHGLCRDTSADRYFMVSMNILQQINGSDFVEQYIQSNIGKSSTLTALNEAFDKSFGADAHLRIRVNCGKDGQSLSEIQMNLPKDLDGRLSDLFARSKDQKTSSCKETIRIPAAK